MSYIVKVKNKKTGLTYAYEQTAKWDPELGQSRPTRKYLGRYVEETGEIIPSSGQRGRSKSCTDANSQSPSEAVIALKHQNNDLSAELEKCRRELQSVREENKKLKDAVLEAARVAAGAASSLRKLADSV